MADTEYQKLPGKGVRSAGLVAVSRAVCSLYLGADHLLQVDTIGGYSEEYKRFYFRDIQAITIRKTQRALIVLCFSVVFALVLALIGRATDDEVGSTIVYVISGVLGLIGIILGIAYARGGASCICHLKTAVQTEQLPSLKRLRNAQKILARVQPLIEQAQGSLSQEEVAAQVSALAQIPPRVQESVYPRYAAISQQSLNKVETPYTGAIHRWLFWLLLLGGLLTVIQIFFHPLWLVFVQMIFELGLVFLVIVALVKQGGSDLTKPTRTVTQVALGYLIANLSIGYAIGMVWGMSDPDSAGNQWRMVERFSELEPFETTWLLIWLLVSSVTLILLGTLGMFFLKQWHDRKHLAKASPVVAFDQPIS